MRGVTIPFWLRLSGLQAYVKAGLAVCLTSAAGMTACLLLRGQDFCVIAFPDILACRLSLTG